jgi:hypothetical protein
VKQIINLNSSTAVVKIDDPQCRNSNGRRVGELVIVYIIAYNILYYWLGDPGLKSRHGQEILFFSKTPSPAVGPPSLLFSGYRGLSVEVKQSSREADHSSPSGDEVSNEWSYTSTFLWLSGLCR